MPNFITIRQTTAEIAIFDFLKWRQSSVSDLLCKNLDHSQKAFGELNCCTKFGSNWLCSSEDNEFQCYMTLS